MKKEFHKFVTVISLFELESGIAQSQNPDREKKKIINALKNQTVIVLDEKSASLAGEIDDFLYKEGAPIDPEDCMIAGIAKHYNQPILTRDKHFQRIKDVKVETY
ncbi:MAG TPA: PIN domain-containing protein [Candidatus Nanoarchaeia archaeon]|nr:PIN domain-containing protein [Candidatus Nanoarchaeia archaeon]